jgi:hypothetical protein
MFMLGSSYSAHPSYRCRRLWRDHVGFWQRSRQGRRGAQLRFTASSAQEIYGQDGAYSLKK